MLDASLSDRLTLGEVGLNVSSPNGIARGLVRPLPIQSASAVGGLLPAGPAVRGDGETIDRARQIENFDDDSQVAVEIILPDGPISNGPPQGEPGWSRPAGALVDAMNSRRDLTAFSIGVSLPGGPAGLPMLAEGLRVAWGRPPVLPTRDLTPEPDELSSLGILSSEAPPIDPGSTNSSPPDDDPDSEIDPTRPRVLRTALIGVAALAVGLLLPDLTAERPLLLHRRTWPKGPRRCVRPRVS